MRKIIALIAATALFVNTTLPAYAADRGGAAHQQIEKALGDLHERIDHTEGLSEHDKARYHEVVSRIEGQHGTIAAATERILVLSGTSVSPEQRAEIEAQVRQELARIGASHADLASMQRKIHAEIQASTALSAAAKAEIEATVQKLEDGSLSLDEAIQSLESKAATANGEGGYGGAFVLVLVLFILLVIVGAGFG